MDLYFSQYQALSVMLSWNIWHRLNYFYQDVLWEVEKFSFKGSLQILFSSQVPNAFNLLRRFHFSTLLCHLDPFNSVWLKKNQGKQYSNKHIFSVWGDTLPWVLRRADYWFYSKSSCINCILYIEMCVKQPLERSFFFFFLQNQLHEFYFLVCLYSRLVCTGVLKWEENLM